eukprot:2664827-Pleurochrysis_carterae.AAC.3
MADVCSRGRIQELCALCARLGVHPKCLQVYRLMSPPSSAPSCRSTKSSTLTCFLLLVMLNSTRALPGGSLPSPVRCVMHTGQTRCLRRLPPSLSALLLATLSCLRRCRNSPPPAQLDAVSREPAPLPSPSAFAYGLTPPPLRPV